MKYRVPFVDYPRHFHMYENELTGAIRDVLSRGDLILRGAMVQFENSIAEYLGLKAGVGTNSGTDALRFSLLAAGIKSGDEVITVAHTFVSTIAVIVQCGATPVLVDVGEDHNMNADLLEAAVTPKTKAVMPVHLNGRACDMEKVMSIAQAHNLIVIEDSAQSLGASFEGKMVGTFGVTGIFSFYPAKSLGAYGDAGMLVTDDQDIADKSRLYRDHGQQRSTGEILFYGYNSRLDNLQAAILNVQLRYFPNGILRRREIAALYQQELSGISGIKLPPPPETEGRYYDTYQNYVIRSKERDKLVSHLDDSGVEVLISWPIPNHYHKGLKLSHFKLPVTEQLSKEVLSLPMYPELDNSQVGIVIDSIRRFYKK